jgi:hypothetical protein
MKKFVLSLVIVSLLAVTADAGPIRGALRLAKGAVKVAAKTAAKPVKALRGCR